MLGYIISDKEEINVEEHEIKSFDILHKTNLNIFVVKNNKVLYKIILYKTDIIENACYYGHIQVLEWFKNSGYKFKHYKYAINYAAQNGHVKILDWFKNSGYKFKYSDWAINYASRNGHVKILKWFKNSGYEFKYNACAITWASFYGYNKILKWFKNSGYEIKYHKNSIICASKHKYVKILKWFKNRNVKKVIKWSSKPLKFIKTIKYKTKNNYMKGYNKN